MKRTIGGIITEEVKVGSINFAELFRDQGLHELKLKPTQKYLYVRTIPLPWAMKMTALPGKSAAVGILLWYLSGVSKNMTVKLSGVQLKRFGIQRSAGGRALKWLEAAGLVKVMRSGNKSPRVTILEV